MQPINLLREEERRLQGQVHRPFMIRTVLALIGALLVLAGARWVVADRLKARDFRMAEREWIQIKSRDQANQQLAAQLRSAEEYERELDAWNRSRLDAGHLLDFVQEAVPDTIQLIRLGWDDDYVLNDKAPGASKTNPQVSRAARMRLAGRARGGSAQALVEALIARISLYTGPSGTDPFFSAVELRSFQAPPAPGTDTTVVDLREFDLDARGLERAFP